MSIFSKLGALIFAPTDAAGNPRQVINHDAQVWATEVERIIQVALEGGDLLVYDSLSALNADLDHAANTGAILIGESITDDGLYMKQGASGSGSWVKIGNVPGQGFVKATNAGAGTANAIEATTPVAVNETQLILLPITAANTASPVTVAFNGGAALTVKTVSGNDVAAGGLPAGSVMLGVIQGGDFRLLSDQASAAIQAAAEAAQAATQVLYDDFNDRYLGPFADNASATAAAGGAPENGAMYWNSSSNELRIWNGATWDPIGSSAISDGAVTRPKLATIISRTIPYSLHEFGAFGAETEGAAPDESVEINTAIQSAIANGRPLFWPGNHFLWGGINFTDAHKLVIEGDHVSPPVVHGTQALADAAGRLFRFNRADYDVDGGVIAVPSDILPNQKKITLSTTSGLAAGMMVSITSDALWYYDNRGTETKGEMHMISRVVSGTVIEVRDYTRDFYDVSVETVTVHAWWPDRLEISSIKAVMPPPATAVSTCCFQTDRHLDARMNDVEIEGFTFCGWLRARDAYTRSRGIFIKGSGQPGGVGYGINSRGSLSPQDYGTKGQSMRRLVDFHGSNGVVCRDALFKDFEMYGGGQTFDGQEYYPAIDNIPNYGVGMHGPSENIRFVDGIISGVQEGVKIRGRNTEVVGVRFLGEIVSCISATFGAGLIVDGCSYERVDYPDKMPSPDTLNDKQAQNFIKFGISAGTGDWNWGAPTSIKNNTANGLRDSFVWFSGTGGTILVENIDCSDNTVLVRPPAASTFEFYKATGNVRIARSKVGPNRMRNDGVGDALIYPSSLFISITSQVGEDGACEIGDNEFLLSMPDDGFAVIPNASRYVDDRIIIEMSDQNGNVYGHFILLQGAAVISPIGAVAASVAPTSNGAGLTGTTGVDGDFTVGLTGPHLYMENRTGATRRIRIKVR